MPGFFVTSNMSTYTDKLRLPSWQKKRLEILSRDAFTCRACSDQGSQLQIHHLKYSPTYDPLDVPDIELITYCNVCHKLAEVVKLSYPNSIIFNVKKTFFKATDTIGCNVYDRDTNNKYYIIYLNFSLSGRTMIIHSLESIKEVCKNLEAYQFSERDLNA